MYMTNFQKFIVKHVPAVSLALFTVSFLMIVGALFFANYAFTEVSQSAMLFQILALLLDGLRQDILLQHMRGESAFGNAVLEAYFETLEKAEANDDKKTED